MRSLIVSLVAVLLISFAGVAQDNTFIRVAHLSPDAPNVDVWVNGNVVLEDVPYEAISSYLSVPAGEHRIQVSPAGATEPIVIDATVEFMAGQAYTVAAAGLLSDGSLGPIVLNDATRVASSMARIRFVHTSADAPAVDVAVIDGPVLFSNVSFRDSGEYLAVNAGTYDLEVRVAGTDTVALSVPGVELQAGMNYSVFATGLLADMTLGALPAVDTAFEIHQRSMANESSRNYNDSTEITSGGSNTTYLLLAVAALVGAIAYFVLRRG